MPHLMSYFTAHRGGDVWYIPWLNTDSLGTSPEGVILHTPQFLQNMQTGPVCGSHYDMALQVLATNHFNFSRILHKIPF